MQRMRLGGPSCFAAREMACCRTRAASINVVTAMQNTHYQAWKVINALGSAEANWDMLRLKAWLATLARRIVVKLFRSPWSNIAQFGKGSRVLS